MNTKSTPRKRTIRIVLLALAVIAAFYVGIPQVLFSIGLALFLLFFPVILLAAIVGGILALAGVGPLGRAVRRRREKNQPTPPVYFVPPVQVPVQAAVPPYVAPQSYVAGEIPAYYPAPYDPAAQYTGVTQPAPILSEEDRLNLLDFDPRAAEFRDLDWDDE